MLKDITLGQYFPGDSALHRTDPRVKIALLLFFILAIFAVKNAACYALLTAFTLFLARSAGASPTVLFGALRPLKWILIFTFFIHLFSTAGTEILTLPYFSPTVEGLEKGIFITLRLALLVFLSALLTLTTSPLLLTDAMESLLTPLKRFGVPAHELAMMMTIALRFIPTLLEETDRIIKAQTARGADFTEGTLLQRMKNLVPVLVPLFLSAFRRADELAMAMEARCYRGGEGRTRVKELHTTRMDFHAALIALLLFACLWALS